MKSVFGSAYPEATATQWIYIRFTCNGRPEKLTKDRELPERPVWNSLLHTATTPQKTGTRASVTLVWMSFTVLLAGSVSGISLRRELLNRPSRFQHRRTANRCNDQALHQQRQPIVDG